MTKTGIKTLPGCCTPGWAGTDVANNRIKNALLAVQLEGAFRHDDGDALINFAQFALGNNPANSPDTGYAPAIPVSAGGYEDVHVRRKGTSAAYSLDADFGEVVNLIPDTGKTTICIRLKIEQQ